MKEIKYDNKGGSTPKFTDNNHNCLISNSVCFLAGLEELALVETWNQKKIANAYVGM